MEPDADVRPSHLGDEYSTFLWFMFQLSIHTLEKVAPWSVISGSFAVCISPLGEYLALDLIQRKEVQSPLT